MKSARDILDAELGARLAEGAKIARAVKERYACGPGSIGCLVERTEVHEFAQAAVGASAMDNMFRRRVNLAARALGARLVVICGRRLFRDMRLRDSDLKVALENSREFARALQWKGPREQGANVPRPETPAEWEALLTSEGMPAELPMIRRETHSDGARGFEEGGGETAHRARAMSAVWDAPSARAEIVDAYQAKISRALDAVHLEGQILSLRGEGLSLRKIGAALRLDKMAVLRILRRRLGTVALEHETED